MITYRILEGLNDSQKQAVTTIDGPLLIVAGPGTGKTLTIVRRIAYLVQQGVRPESILAVTFTNRAAREMRERAEALLGEAASSPFIGTFHFLGLTILRNSGIRDFILYGTDEQLGIVKSLLNGSAKKARQAAEKISRIKNYLEVPDSGFQEIFDAYQAALTQQNAYDFDDLIRVPVEQLAGNPGARDRRLPFKYIIVDEYQDINPAQYRLLRLLAGNNHNVCAVGDSDQAIYAFRGADIGNFLAFTRDFPAASRVTLSRNYRSTDTIVLAADSMIRYNAKRLAKEVSGSGERGASIAVLSAPDDRAESAAIIAEIEARMGGTSSLRLARHQAGHDIHGSPYGFSDFAVIYRTNAQARALEQAFAASGIPFQVIGKRGAVQRKEIAGMLLFLQSLAGHEPGESGESGTDAAETKLPAEADYFDPRADAVALMTLHMAKGLEFRVVFIAGCEDALLPCTIMKDSVDVEEERRLLYVGMTRAREELFLLRARKRFLYGQSLEPGPSRFIDEIPEEFKACTVIADAVKKQDRQMGLF